MQKRIVFNKSGRIIEGIEALEECVRSGKPITADVVFGAEDNAGLLPMLNVDDGVPTNHGRESRYAGVAGPGGIPMPKYLFALLVQSRDVMRRDEAEFRRQGLPDLAHGPYEMAHRIQAVLHTHGIARDETAIVKEMDEQDLRELQGAAAGAGAEGAV